MVKKRTKLLLCVFFIHVIASLVGHFVFDYSLHKHMPWETEGGELPLWLLPLEIVFVPFRICMAATGTLFGGRITLSQRPFAVLTATYLGVFVALSLSTCFLLKLTHTRDSHHVLH
jgi:hypothetical protein